MREGEKHCFHLFPPLTGLIIGNWPVISYERL